MTDREFDTMLQFKGGAGIAVLAAWVRELRNEYEQEIKWLKKRIKELEALTK